MLKKGKTVGGKGASEEGDKNGEKSRGREREREKSFFCQEQLFHIYRRDIPRACRAEEGVRVKERDETKRGAFFFAEWNVLPSHDGIYKLRRTNV